MLIALMDSQRNSVQVEQGLLVSWGQPRLVAAAQAGSCLQSPNADSVVQNKRGEPRWHGESN